MPKENVSYSCTICGARYKTFKQAEECENAHKLLKCVNKPEYSSGDRKSDYPLSVLVHFKDCTSAKYYRK